MPPTPQFSYFLYNTQTPVSPDDPAWQQRLPLSRNLSDENDGDSIKYGDYFRAIRRFLEINDFETISTVLAQHLNTTAKLAEISAISICLTKHGQFYHPARLIVSLGRQSATFVLNVAISDTGLRTIQEEYRNLKYLDDEFALSFIPKVYHCAEIEIAGHRKIRLFLGDWLEGYHEFHLSAAPSGAAVNMLLWDGQGSRSVLSTAQQAQIYRQAARILAYYYNVETFEQIFAWHHAAGDFVVKVEKGAVDLKLIAVRRYAPLLKKQNDLEAGGTDVAMMLQTLLLFFLNLSIRMRLDRLNGIGDVVWAEPLAVAATIQGFFEGLALKPSIPSLPDTIARCFAYFLSVSSEDDIGDLCRSVAARFDRRVPETVIVRQNLEAHIIALTRSIKQYLSSA